MAGFEDLRALFRRRLLTAVARDLLGPRESSKCKEELQRQRRLLAVIMTPEIKLQRADIHQLITKEEEVLPEQQERSSSLKQENPAEAAHIKEEQEGVWISQGREQLQGSEEADSSMSMFTPVSVKSEDDDEERPQSSQLREDQDVLQLLVMKEQSLHVKSEKEDEEKPQSSKLHQVETRAVGEDCGGNYERNSAPTEVSSEAETDDSDDWKEDRQHQQSLNHVKRNQVQRLKPGEKPFSCSECGQTFTFKSNLIRHKMLHTGEKPFSCSECGKTFRYKSYLNNHKLVHTGEKPFSCSVCAKTFRSKSHLNSHKLFHTGEKPFSCSVCGETFRAKAHLNNHKLYHTGEKPFSCSECGKTFRAKSSLKRHKIDHYGVRPFSCDECGKTFPAKRNLSRHKLIHTGEKPFSCDECGITFRHKTSLKSHKLYHTREALSQ